MSFFDRIVLINLPQRLDKRMSALQQTAYWGLPQPTIFPAIWGDGLKIPDWWKEGGPAFGCRASHLAILTKAIDDGIEKLFIVEDDLLLCRNFENKFTHFMAKVNQFHWDCLMIGGQHYESEPEPIMEGVVKCTNTQRTHAYAVQGEFIKLLRDMWAEEKTGHIDWRMGPFCAKYNTYAPNPFLIGQSGGVSDITNRDDGNRFWNPVSRPKHILARQT